MQKILSKWWRVLVLALWAALAWPLPFWAGSALVPPATSPFVLLGAAMAARTVGFVALVGLPFLVLIFIVQRGFCRFVCPTGLLIDWAGWVGRQVIGRVGRIGETECGTAPVAGGFFKTLRAGQWLALLTLGGAVLGWPLFLWLDPMALFGGGFGFFHRPLTAASVCAALGLPLVLLLSLFRPNLWCGKLCPLGGLQDCASLLKKNLRSPPPVSTSAYSGPKLARRSLVALGLGAVGAAAARTVSGRREALRPPGGQPEPDFSALCVRCGNCIRSCPVKILRPDLGQHGVAGFLAPVLHLDDTYCREDCARCGEVCPSGAIRRFSLAEKPKAIIGQPKLAYLVCLLASEQECSECKNACPYEAIEIVFDKKEYRAKPKVIAERCNGCGACQIACPTSPKAIEVKPIG